MDELTKAGCAKVFFAALVPQPSLAAIYALLTNAMARTFEQPTMQSLVPVMAPRVILSRAVAAQVSARHLAVLIGPSLGGVLYIFDPVFDYGVCTTMVLAAFIATLLLPGPGKPAQQPDVTLDTILAGFRFIWRCEVRRVDRPDQPQTYEQGGTIRRG